MERIGRWARLATTLLLGVWGWALIRDPNETILHVLTLPIHETGHMVFMAFGELMHAAGGTIFQILFPLVFAVYFYVKGDRHAAIGDGVVPRRWICQLVRIGSKEREGEERRRPDEDDRNEVRPGELR